MPTGGAITGAEHLFFFPCKGPPRGLVSRPESPLSRGIIRPTRVLSYHRHDETPRTAAPVAPLRRPSSLSVSASRSLSPQPGRCEALEREREGEGEFERCRESDAPHRNHEPKRTDEKPRRGGRSVAWASLDRVPLALQHRPPCRSAGSRGASPVRGMFTERSRQPTQWCADNSPFCCCSSLPSLPSYLRRKQNKGWLSAVASAIARRDVSVRCPGFSAKLVESTLYTLTAS